MTLFKPACFAFFVTLHLKVMSCFPRHILNCISRCNNGLYMLMISILKFQRIKTDLWADSLPSVHSFTHQLQYDFLVPL